MSLAGVLDAALADPALRHARERAAARSTSGAATSLDLAGPPGVWPMLVAVLAHAAPRGAGRPVLAVTPTARAAEDLATAARCFLPPQQVVEFPAWETLPHERLSPRSDTVGRRLAVLRRLAHPSETATGPAEPVPTGTPEQATGGPIRVVVAPVRAVLQPIVRGLGELRPVRLRPGDDADLDDVTRRLADAAYSRVDLVERRGQFAVRGGILDVFAPTEEHPQRVEFFGDSVEEVRWFSVADQRSLEPADAGLWAPPCRELLLTDAVRKRARELAPRLSGATDLLDRIADGIATEGMESLTPVLVDAMETLVDVLPAGAHVVVCDPERVRARAHDLVATNAEFLAASWSNATAGGAVPVDLTQVQRELGRASFHELGQVREHALNRGVPWWTVGPFTSGVDVGDTAGSGAVSVAAQVLSPAQVAREPDEAAGGLAEDGAVSNAIGARSTAIGASEPEPYRGDTGRALADAGRWAAQGWRVMVVTEGPGLAQRVVEVLGEQDVAARQVDAVPNAPEPGVVHVGTGGLGHGLVAPGIGLALLTETELTGGTDRRGGSAARRMPARRRGVVDPLQLRPGDHVVHEQHGVGRFVEMVQRTIQGATREYLVIEYAPSKRGQPGDRLFVPSDALDQVTRYVGGEAPTLNKLGGSDWARTKGRARKAVKQIAGELIRLYSARMATQGHAFGPDTPWQRELEDAFAFVETPDQLVTIDEVKADMQRSVPMDRLICGDVGYGKTEIAVRAAFKAVQDGKQVAVLVPTTLLVQQHLQTFTERYAGFPVVVRALSRFSSDREAREVLEGMRTGAVDVVIGTHRLLSANVTFKDLGLIVVDEEQRFGVEHKEQLKAMRTAVDVLAMSATPIPRTLEMAVTGIREMSTLATPPEERHPVLTFVGGYDEKQITAAVRRELLREGQIFYVHHKVASIERAAARLRELVPEARIATAHGQLGEHRLEQVVLDFWEKRFDVLVCTTIIETGLDISNANTLIVERSDVLGLSQLHQLRGRVGRGRERAYSYFLYPPEKPLTETALDRLQTIAQHTDLGSGMAVAMKDLQIRGAGNLLGGEQSGHIEGVGFDLYVRLVGEAVAEYRGDGHEPLAEMKVDLPVDAHLPHDYVPGERLRLEAYKKLADADTDDAVAAVRAELVDRYGEPPQPVERLLAVARLRGRARRAGLAEIAAAGNHVRFGPVELRESQQLRLARLYPGVRVRAAARVVEVPRPTTARVGGRPLRDGEVLDWARGLIDAVLLDDVAAAAVVGARG
ncbi:MAG: transcription-repair coupling factor [Angustibacter sp.]